MKKPSLLMTELDRMTKSGSECCAPFANTMLAVVLSRTTLLIAVLVAFVCHSAEVVTDKKLIEFGWDEPGPAFMREHFAEMEQTPFDGCVFHVDYTKPTNGSGSFTWESCGSRACEMTELQKTVDDLK